MTLETEETTLYSGHDLMLSAISLFVRVYVRYFIDWVVCYMYLTSLLRMTTFINMLKCSL